MLPQPCDYIAGQRFHPDWTRVGGLMCDLPDEDTFRTMVRTFIDQRLPKAMTDLETLLNRNRIFIDRTGGVGSISKEDAIAWSLTGPIARASGVRRDLRKDEPYLCYADDWDGQGAGAVEFSVPIAPKLLQFREEMRVRFPSVEEGHSVLVLHCGIHDGWTEESGSAQDQDLHVVPSLSRWVSRGSG